MKTNWNEPQLMVDDHHGVYMMELFVKYQEKTNSLLWKQIQKDFGPTDIDILKDSNNEFHIDLCDSLTNKTFKTETGQKFCIQYAEGGLWAIPNNFMRNSKKVSEFFGN